MSETPLSRRRFLGAAASGVVAVAAVAVGAPQLLAQVRSRDLAQARPSLPAGVPAEMAIYKDPSCGCCTEWVKHVQAAGFKATVHDTSDMNAVKASLGVPASLHSCHTAKVGAYVVEGHVPADLVVKLLRDKPADARGLAVPGMPVGSPGMEMGGRKDKYDVMVFDKAGKSRVYASR